MWAAQFPKRQSDHYVFPFEKCGAKGEGETLGFTGGVVIYDTDPARPIGDWKEAWEKAKERAGAILRGETDLPQPAKGKRRPDKSRDKSENHPNGKLSDGSTMPGPLNCGFHDLRHSAVTRLLEAGIPYPVVASMMGWSAATAIRMAKRYGHIGNQALRDAADVLGGVKIQPASLKKSPKSPEIENALVQ